MLMFHDGRYIEPEEENAVVPDGINNLHNRKRLRVALELARTVKDLRKIRTVSRPLPAPKNVPTLDGVEDDHISASETTRYDLLRSQLVAHFQHWRL